MYTVRSAINEDYKKIVSLYRSVINQGGPGGISIGAYEKEISVRSVKAFMKKAFKGGFELVVNHPKNSDKIIGELHCSPLQPSVFNHVLGQFVVAVDPNFQGQGVGTKLFTTLQNEIQKNRPDICRVELFVFEFHHKGVEFYKKLGFKVEGKMEKRFAFNDKLETDFPMAWFNPNYKPSAKTILSSRDYRQYPSDLN